MVDRRAPKIAIVIAGDDAGATQLAKAFEALGVLPIASPALERFAINTMARDAAAPNRPMGNRLRPPRVAKARDFLRDAAPNAYAAVLHGPAITATLPLWRAALDQLGIIATFVSAGPAAGNAPDSTVVALEDVGERAGPIAERILDAAIDVAAPATERWDRLAVIIAPPRSGTTVLAASLAAHSSVHAVFEPWNDRSQALPLDLPMAFAEFCTRFPRTDDRRSTLAVKETTISPQNIARVRDLLVTAPRHVERSLIVPMRNPFHVYLSLAEGRRLWWGNPDYRIDRHTFTHWARTYIDGISSLIPLLTWSPALLVSYRHLSEGPAALDEMTSTIGLTPEPAQHEIAGTIDVGEIRGDPRFAQAPGPFSDRATRTRTLELLDHDAELRSAKPYAAIRQLADAIDALPSVSDTAAQPGLLRMLRELG